MDKDRILEKAGADLKLEGRRVEGRVEKGRSGQLGCGATNARSSMSNREP